ncbi:MAG: NmrA/HSCARG family protein, partial [Bacteroidetes bacterium]|nr:NmrA/HSCARG family protein [Bacteroidota bacterium]
PESIEKAVAGCYGVFGVTNFWEHFTKEFDHGLTLIDAVKRAGVQHFVFSTLPDYNKLSGFQIEVPHCDLKAELERYTVLQGIPSTFVHIAFYYENFVHFFPPQLGEDGQFHFGFPQGDTPLAMASVDDMGPIVAAVFGKPSSYIGRTVGVVGEDDTCTAYAATMTRVLGKPIHYTYIPKEIYATFNFPGAGELANMFEVQRLHIRGRRQHLQESYCMHPGMQSFETWLLRNKQQFGFLQKSSIAINEL